MELQMEALAAVASNLTRVQDALRSSEHNFSKSIDLNYYNGIDDVTEIANTITYHWLILDSGGFEGGQLGVHVC